MCADDSDGVGFDQAVLRLEIQACCCRQKAGQAWIIWQTSGMQIHSSTGTRRTFLKQTGLAASVIALPHIWVSSAAAKDKDGYLKILAKKTPGAESNKVLSEHL